MDRKETTGLNPMSVISDSKSKKRAKGCCNIGPGTRRIGVSNPPGSEVYMSLCSSRSRYRMVWFFRNQGRILCENRRV